MLKHKITKNECSKTRDSKQTDVNENFELWNQAQND